MPRLGFKCLRIGLAFLAVEFGGPASAPACNVPVFRYALEHWAPDRYVLLVFHREPFSAEQLPWVGAMETQSQIGAANLLVRRVNVTGTMSPPFQELWKSQGNPELPWLVARFPAQTGFETPVWSGPLSANLPQTLVDSPARREIASRLSRGDTAVWLLLESEDRDEKIERLLETESRKLERTLKLPESLPGDPQMDMNLPLRIAFSTVRVNRFDPAERLLVSQLLNGDPRLKNLSQTMLFPIFGRGRVLPPAIGERIRAEAINAMAKLLTGPCSCQVKEMNPGYDLLLTANWSALIDNPVPQEAKLPPLTGLSQLAALRANQPAAALNPTNSTATPAVSGGLKRNLLSVAALGALALAAGTFIFMSKTGIRPL